MSAEAGRPLDLPMFPLSTVLLPGELLPLQVFEPRYREMIADCLAAERSPHFGVVLIARGSEVGGGDVRTDVGTAARIEGLWRADAGRYRLLARGVTRLEVRQWLADDPYPRATVQLVGDCAVDDARVLSAAAAAVRRVEALASELGQTPAPAAGDGAAAGDDGGDGDGAGAPWALCRRLPLGSLDRQRLLSADDPRRRLELLIELAEARADDLSRLLAGG